ncbi:hypothetical protein MAIT1_03546 [Magnetofaba australis IT-1]|uniref:TIGR00341 family protein n=1 Tax=Magnetofaba australis IT-1 TaxID=1434232 RepID=A0A1Y2K6S2_9PROT|nr:hypothetical protein MAIT1_03546 [Magnetofaba australis IT-1]
MHFLHDGAWDDLRAHLEGVAYAAHHFTSAQDALPGDGAVVLLYLDDERVRGILPTAVERGWEVAVLPHPEAPLAAARFGVERDLAEAVAHALQASAQSVRLLTCNDVVAFSSVTVGETLTLEAQRRSGSRWSVLGALARNVFKLRPFRYALSTAKEQSLTTAGIGLIILEGPTHGYLGKGLASLTVWDDQRLTALALAPRSVVGYLGLLWRIIVLRAVSQRALPPAMGLIRSARLAVETGRGVDYALDGRTLHADRLEITAVQTPLQVRLGARYPQADGAPPPDRDQFRMQGLPSGESARILDGARLPLFNHAAEDDFKELFQGLKESASFSRSFFALMVMSALLALFGLYANSAPVIIGAMILAPLMGPIISLSMGLARAHPLLIRDSVKTLLLGILTALLCAIVVAKLMPLRVLTHEMAARLSPNLLDLGVAVVSGMAGAYANAREEIAKGLAGVAIAVALVPPLCVLGIGLGWMDWSVVSGASLLFATNLVGIAVAGSVAFLALGFAPFHLARKGLWLSLALLGAVSVPLYLAFDKAIQSNRILSALGQARFADNAGYRITPLSVQQGRETVARVRVTSERPISSADLDAIQQRLSQAAGMPLTIEATVALRRSARPD